VTVALATADPAGSTTVPVIEPAACWADAVDDAPGIPMMVQAPIAINNIRLIRFTELLLENRFRLTVCLFEQL
jgi:hypothetical protein